MRINLPRSTCAYRLVPKASCGETSGGLRHFPGARVIAKRLVVERAHRAQIDDVGRQLMIDAVFDVGADFHVLAAAGGAHLRIALDFRAEAHAARAVDAAGHVGGDQGPEVLVLDHALALAEARDVAAVPKARSCSSHSPP